MKTEEYEIIVSINDMLTFKTKISKKEYLRLKKDLKKQHSSHSDSNKILYTEHESKTIEKETYSIYQDIFTYLTNVITLREYVCDTGFHF